MEAYVGKPCNCCGQILRGDDEVIVCPACGKPHHVSCWIAQQGCTTTGCSEQSEGAKAFLRQQAQAAHQPAMQSPPVQAVPYAAPPLAAPLPAKKKSRAGLWIGLTLAVLVLAALSWLLLPRLFKSPEKLMAEGNYEKAYKISKGSEQDDVVKENGIAVCCAASLDGLKDASSFELVNGWYQEGKIVLEVRAHNSLGAKVKNYYYYTYDSDDKVWELFTSFTDLDEETIYSWDDSSEALYKEIKNIALRNVVKPMIRDDSMKLSKEGVKRINALFEKDLLEEVKPLPVFSEMKQKMD